MIYKFILFYFTLSIHLFAYSSFDISNLANNTNLINYTYCIEDSNRSLNFENILLDNNLQSLEKSNIGYTQSSYWCVVKLKNSSQDKKSIILYNLRSGMDYIDVHVDKKNSIKKFNLGDMRPLKNRSLPSVFSNILVNLEADEEILIFSHLSNVGPLELTWSIQDVAAFISFDKMDSALTFLYNGFLLSMMIYMFFMFLLFKDKLYIIYSLYILTAIITNAALQGSMHYLLNEHFDYFSMTLFNWNIVHVNLALLWLFIFYFFNLNRGEKYYRIVIFMIGYNLLISLFYSFAYIDTSVLQFSNVIAITALIESIFMFVLSSDMFLKRKHGSGYFLIAHVLYIIVVIKYIFMLIGSTEFNILNRHLLELAVFFMITFMSISLISRLKGIEKENKIIKKQLDNNRQYLMIGTTISYISHQWKQPLSILSAQVLNLLFIIDKNPDTPISNVKNKILKLESRILYLNDTLISIKKLFTSETTNNANFKILDCIKNIKEDLSIPLTESNIVFSFSIDDKETLYGNENLFLHAISNIIQNSIEAFNSTTPMPFIKITSKTHTNHTLSITIEDNAGGIKISPIKSIFESNITNKTFGTGIGLSLSKNILESNFNASIEVENSKDGALFKITNLRAKSDIAHTAHSKTLNIS